MYAQAVFQTSCSDVARWRERSKVRERASRQRARVLRTDLLIEPIDDLRRSVECRDGIDGRPDMGPNDCLPDMDIRDIGSVWYGDTRVRDTSTWVSAAIRSRTRVHSVNNANKREMKI